MRFVVVQGFSLCGRRRSWMMNSGWSSSRYCRRNQQGAGPSPARTEVGVWFNQFRR